MKANTLASIRARLVPDGTGCLFWPGRPNPKSKYAYVSYQGRMCLLHKLLWEAENGPVPAGLQLDHLCHVRRCGNVDHLEPVTQSVNTRRGITNAAKMLCCNGHVLAGLNVYIAPGGVRHCRQCIRDRKERDRRARSAFIKATSTHCRRGHPYPADLLARGLKKCRVCGARRARESVARRKARQREPQLFD